MFANIRALPKRVIKFWCKKYFPFLPQGTPSAILWLSYKHLAAKSSPRLPFNDVKKPVKLSANLLNEIKHALSVWNWEYTYCLKYFSWCQRKFNTRTWCCIARKGNAFGRWEKILSTSECVWIPFSYCTRACLNYVWLLISRNIRFAAKYIDCISFWICVWCYICTKLHKKWIWMRYEFSNIWINQPLLKSLHSRSVFQWICKYQCN